MKKIETQIDNALTREPDFKLPVGFADGLVKIIEESRAREKRWEIFWIGFGGFLFFIALIVVLVLIDFKPTFSGSSFLTTNVGLIVFGILFVLLLNLLDKKFIRKAEMY